MGNLSEIIRLRNQGYGSNVGEVMWCVLLMYHRGRVRWCSKVVVDPVLQHYRPNLPTRGQTLVIHLFVFRLCWCPYPCLCIKPRSSDLMISSLQGIMEIPYGRPILQRGFAGLQGQKSPHHTVHLQKISKDDSYSSIVGRIMTSWCLADIRLWQGAVPVVPQTSPKSRLPFHRPYL